MGAFKLGKMTFGSLFKKPETVLYPIVEKPKPAGLKGHIVNHVDNCILCGMCERSCSTGCIRVDRQAATWSIDRLQCVQCGYCTTVCPKKCLEMDPHYAPVTTKRAFDVFDVPASEKPVKPKADEPAAKGEPAKMSEPAAKADVEAEPAQPAAVAGAVEATDKQVEALMGMMDSEKAEKVKAALGM